MRVMRFMHAPRTSTCHHMICTQDTPFFTVKLQIKMLPCVVFFKHGKVVDQVVGFDGLGAKDDFETSALEDRMYHAEVRWGQAAYANVF